MLTELIKSEMLTKIEGMLQQTANRDLFSSSEMQDVFLDLHSAISKLDFDKKKEEVNE